MIAQRPTRTTPIRQWIQQCFIFLSGILVGSIFFGTANEPSLTIPCSPAREASTTATTLATTTQGIKCNHEDGWQSIDVFYGSTDHVVSKLPKDQKWFAQAAQEQVVLSLLRQQRGGFFVDLASNDATFLSNTYILERDYGWKGLCIEPNPVYWYNLTHYRPQCQIVGAVIGHKTMEQLHFLYASNEHGGIAGEGFDNGKKWQHKATKEYTVTLQDVFERYQIPKTIDYLSLDVEGAENFIMSAFPLEDYKIKLLTIERPNDDLKQLLESHGYQNLQRLSRWGETLWAHRDYIPELDLTHLEKFHGRLQKDMQPYSTIV